MDGNKSFFDLIASLAVIQTNIALYFSGNKFSYLPVAVELRKLLCDTQSGNNNSLIPRLITDFRLNPLSGNQDRIDEFTKLYIPCRIEFDGKGGSKLTELFNENAPRITLDQWLEQKLFDSTMTLRVFIRTIADKEAAHSDKAYNPVLVKLKNVRLPDDTLAIKTIIAIGCFIIKSLALEKIHENRVEISNYINKEFIKVGRGWAIIDLNRFAANYGEGITLEFKQLSDANLFFKFNPSMCTEIINKIQSYDPTLYFILMVKELNREYWFYEIPIIT